MRVYLDTCSLQRPLDTKSHPRIHLESEAILVFISFCEAGMIQLLSSEALFFEISRTRDEVRRDYALAVMAKATARVEASEPVIARARIFQEAGIHPLDALHLSSAVQGEADLFCTCDDKLLRRARAVETARTKVVSALELIQEIDRWLSS